MIEPQIKKSVLVFTVPYNHAFALATVILDLKKYSPNLTDDIIVYHNGILDRDQALINSILPTEFIKYQFPVNKKANLSKVTTKYFTLMLFARFETLKLLDRYNCVIYSDYDVIIKGDLSEILDYSTSGWSVIPSSTRVRETLYQPISKYDTECESFSGGLFVLWDCLGDYNSLHEWCYEALGKYAQYFYIADIAIFSLLWQEFNIKPSRNIDTNIYCCHPTHVEYLEKAKIIHAYGPQKFWNGWYFEQWEKHYKIWTAMGGSVCFDRTLLGQFKNNLKRIIKRLSKVIQFKN